MTLGSAAKAHLTLVAWCKDYRHHAEIEPAEMAKRYGAETTVIAWSKRLVCGQCSAECQFCGER
jgi:hypothetical protein